MLSYFWMLSSVFYDLITLTNFSGRIKEKLLATQKSSNPHTYLVKVRSMQVLGCLICQLYNPKRFRTLDENCSFELRYKTCIDVLTKEGKNIGLGIKKLVTSLLLQDESKPFNLQITDRNVYFFLCIDILISLYNKWYAIFG